MSVLNYAVPPILQLEPTTDCNLSCPFCLRTTLNRSETYISFEDFLRILDTAKCRYLTLHGWGEPLLHPDLPAMIRSATERKIPVNFTTNATLLPEKTRDLLDSGLDAIAFSFPESGQFTPLIEKNVAGFLQERASRGLKGPRTYLNIALMEDNLQCIEEGLALAAATGVDKVSFERSFPWGEAQAKTEKSLFTRIKEAAKETGCKCSLPPGHTNPCPLVRLTMFVRTNGDVAPCCYRAGTILGNLLREDLASILRKRAAFMRGMQRDPVCRACRV